VHGKPASWELSSEQIATFRREGVLVIPGLLRDKELQDAIRAVKRIQRSQNLAQRVFYRLFPSYKSLQFQSWRKHRALEKVAFDSAAPTICAQLMGLSCENNNNNPRCVRLLKDAVLGYRAGDRGCGWHVDDKIFWPCEDRNVGKPDAGINVWITLSPVSCAEGGGLAVAPGSHRKRFAKRARQVIASKGHVTTNLLETLDPECHEKMESLKRVYDLEPGDAIVHDRYIFHRAYPFVDPIEGKKAGVKHRISLRYVPEDATFFDLAGKERAAEVKMLSTGDKISKGGEYYPQTWPDSLPEERGKKVLEDENDISFKLLLKILRNKKKK